ncbi:MAG: hypothetical protein US55_C0031G0001, partial [Candidatus Levybacteria bacterium GW2011_GWC2_37_7]
MLVTAIENKVKYDEWKSRHASLVLARPSVEQLAGVVENRMKELKHDGSDQSDY